MNRTRIAALAALLIASGALGAQSVARSVQSSDGTVQVLYPSRPTVCGDGATFIGNILGDDRNAGRYDSRPCIHGPVRVLATVIDGHVTRLRTFVGPVPASASSVRTVAASAGDAVAWLSELVVRSPGRAAAEAVMPLVAADAPDPWPLLLRVSRDENRPREVRRSALLWLGMGVNQHLGLGDADEHASDDDEMRAQAVFVLSQRKDAQTIPDLIDVARTSKRPSTRKAAIFWLGQSGDRRVPDVYAELLGLK
jgi:hypothetical protein